MYYFTERSLSTACHQGIKKIYLKCEPVRETLENPMKKYVYYTPRQYKLMAEALEKGEAHEGDDSFTRQQVAINIQKIMSCFLFRVNPLSQLRILFPNFEWEFHDLSSALMPSAYEKAVRKLVMKSDIFWEVEGLYSRTFVNARLQGGRRPPMKLYGSHTFRQLEDDLGTLNACEFLGSMHAYSID